MREALRSSSAMTVNPENVIVTEENNAGTSKGAGITRLVDNVHSETSNDDGITRHVDNVENKPEIEPRDPLQPGNLPCPLCNSADTKSLFYNNKKLSQPRHYCRLCRSSWTQCGTLFNQNSSVGKNITPMFEHVERGEDANVSSADANAETPGLKNGLRKKGREKISVETFDDDGEDLELGKKRRRGRQVPAHGKHMTEPDHAPCLRCNSTNTKFLSYNNYKLSQPRYMCNSCCKSWTHGGTIREKRGEKIRRVESSDKDKGIARLDLEEGGETNNAHVNAMVGQVANLTDPESVEDSSGETKMRSNHKVNKGIRKDDETNTTDGNEMVTQVAYLSDPECAVDTVGAGKMKGKRNGYVESEEMECNQEANAHDDNRTGNADVNAVTSGLEIGIGRQGRGRRGLENSDDKEKVLKIEKNRGRGQWGPPRSTHRREPDHAPCPRCDSTNTKFVAYNNYKLSQPRYLCNSCLKSWTRGGTIREQMGKNRRAERSGKKKCIVDSCLEEGGETKSIDGSEMAAHVTKLADPDCAEDSVRERKIEGKRNGSEVSEEIKHNEGADGYAHGDNHTGKPEIGRGLKGMKRKWVEGSVRNGDDGTHAKKVEEFFFGGMAQVVGRTLRSRTLEKNDIEKTVDVGLVEGVMGVMGKKDTDVSNKNTTEIENGDTALLIDMRKKKIKGKVHDKSWLRKASGSEKRKEMGFRENGNQPKSGKVIRGPNFLDNGKQKRLVSKLRHSGQKKQSERGKQKEGGDCKRSTEKQLLRDRIIAMLKSAGWTIDYRQRSGREKGREYFDAVYVSPQGRGLWSVTLAYEILRKQVESGNADSRSVAAFTPIPEEELSKLFRLTKKKMGLQSGLKGQREGTDKKHKGVSQKKFKKKIANRGTKKKSSDNDQDVLASTVQRGMQRSHRRKRQNGKRCALAARHSMKGLDPDNKGFEQYDGKRSLLSWMIDLGTVPLGGKVQYKNHGRTEVLLEGRIARDGIHCDCCNKTLTLAEFETHAGSKDPQPFQNIYLGSGSSLLQCLVDSWKKYDRSECAGIHSVDIDRGDPNDDTCNKCGDGGDLICCDGCPSTFHQSCLNIQKFPSGDWHCVYCSCKFCGIVGGNTCQNHDATDFPLLTCCLCEEKYHLLCIQVNSGVHVDSDCPSFCGEKCQEVFERLQALLGVKNQLEEGYSWTLCRRFDVNPRTSLCSDPSKIECNSKLAVALSILDECFLPIVDQRSGINMIRNVVYSCGSNFTRLNYTGFFTAILERGDEMISAASIRIHGSHSAEMPFIGTRHIYRRQGMCRRLLNAIELALCSLNVEKLVIPAISELLQTWTSVFGFMPLEESSKKEMKHMNIIVFPGVNMLQKSLLRQKFGRESLISTAGTTRTEHKTEHQTSHAHRSSDTAAAECDAFDVTSETVKLEDSVTTGKCLLHSTTHDNKECENNQIKDSEVSGGDALELDGHRIAGEMDEQKNVHELFDVSQIAPVATKCEGSLDVKAVHLSAEIMAQPQDATLPHSKVDVLQIHEPEIVASVHNDCFPLVGALDDITEPSSQASHISNGLCKSSECHCGVDENDTCAAGVGQTSCVVTGKDILELKAEFTAAHNTDSCSLDVDSFPSRPQISANCSKESGSGSQVESQIVGIHLA